MDPQAHARNMAVRDGSGDGNWMHAFAHPTRLRILELLRNEWGPLTATDVGEALGLSPANCSYHLRALSKYGLIEEAGRDGRRRPWRASDQAAGRAQRERGAGLGQAGAISGLPHSSTHDEPPLRSGPGAPVAWQSEVRFDDLQRIQDEFTKVITRYVSRQRPSDPRAAAGGTMDEPLEQRYLVTIGLVTLPDQAGSHESQRT